MTATSGGERLALTGAAQKRKRGGGEPTHARTCGEPSNRDPPGEPTHASQRRCAARRSDRGNRRTSQTVIAVVRVASPGESKAMGGTGIKTPGESAHAGGGTDAPDPGNRRTLTGDLAHVIRGNRRTQRSKPPGNPRTAQRR